MKATEPGRWQRTSPFAILFFLGRLARDIAKNAWQSIAPLIAVAYASAGGLVDKIIVAAVVAAIGVVVVAVLRYWFFRFRIAEDAVLIREGVLRKRQLDIRYERIQGINTEQNVVFRYLDLVTVTFDTAGSAQSEGKLPAVTRAFADALRERIGNRRRGMDADGSDRPATEPVSLLRLGWRDMIRIGLSDRRVLVVLAVLGPVMQQIGDRPDDPIGRFVVNTVEGIFRSGVEAGVLTSVAIVLGVIAILAIASVATAFLRYHRFELTIDGSTLHSTGGLLTQHDVAMELGKIQTLWLQQGLVLRAFRRFRMTAVPARSGHRSAAKKTFVVPLSTAGVATGLCRRFLGEESRGLTPIPASRRFAPISPRYLRTRILLNALAAIAATGLAWLLTRNPASFWLLAWLPVSSLVVYSIWRHAGYIIGADGLVRRSGLVGYRTATLLYRKVQRVTVTQAPTQRRRNLANLRVYTAAGSVKLPYIEHDLAKRLRDYILYRVETSRRAWH